MAVPEGVKPPTFGLGIDKSDCCVNSLECMQVRQRARWSAGSCGQEHLSLLAISDTPAQGAKYCSLGKLQPERNRAMHGASLAYRGPIELVRDLLDTTPRSVSPAEL